MSRQGCIRKTLLIGVLTWVFVEFLVFQGPFVTTPELQWIGAVALCAVAVGGVFNLIQKGLDDDHEND